MKESCLIWIGREICKDQALLQTKSVYNSSKLIFVCFDVRGQQEMDLFTGGVLSWIIGSYFFRKLKMYLLLLCIYLYLLQKMLIDGLDWSGVDNLWMFLSAIWTLTAPIHCWGSIGEQVMQCYISPNLFWWIHKLIHTFGWPEGEYVFSKFIFVLNVYILLCLLWDNAFCFTCWFKE